MDDGRLDQRLAALEARLVRLEGMLGTLTERLTSGVGAVDEAKAGIQAWVTEYVSLRLQQDDSFYPVLGYLVGQLAQDRIPVIDGLQHTPTEDQLKAFGAAAASSGAVALFHWVGVTPEAPSVDVAFQGSAPAQVIDLTMDQLREAWQALTTSCGEQLDMVVLGSPHFSLAEFKQLVPLVGGKRRHPSVEFLITSSRAVTALAQQVGLLEALQHFGAKLTVDTCILTTPMLPAGVQVLMTNSAKYAYYAPGLLGTQVVFGSLSDCVNSAIAGRIVRDESLWRA